MKEVWLWQGIAEPFTRIASGLPLWEPGTCLIFPSIDIDGVQQSRRTDLESGEG